MFTVSYFSLECALKRTILSTDSATKSVLHAQSIALRMHTRIITAKIDTRGNDGIIIQH